jgi:hypothetical protein
MMQCFSRSPLHAAFLIDLVVILFLSIPKSHPAKDFWLSFVGRTFFFFNEILSDFAWLFVADVTLSLPYSFLATQSLIGVFVNQLVMQIIVSGNAEALLEPTASGQVEFRQTE